MEKAPVISLRLVNEVVLPDDLLADVDALVGSHGRSAFLTEVIRDEVNRRRLLQILRDPEPILKPGDYPEFETGSEAWVPHLREGLSAESFSEFCFRTLSKRTKSPA